MNAPATPTMTAEIIVFLGILATPKTTIPAMSEARDLWSLRIGTESKTLLIRGTKNGAIKDADITAIIAGSRTTPVTLLPKLPTDAVNEKSKILPVYQTAKNKVMPVHA